MNMTPAQIKDIITFARSNGVRRLKVGRLEVVFEQDTADIESTDNMTEDQIKQAYTRTLLASSG
jgi:hypothetical protein